MSIAKECTIPFDMNSQIRKGEGGHKAPFIYAANASLFAAEQYAGLFGQGDTMVVKGGGSLGSREFVETKIKCKDEDTGELVALHRWQDNKPGCYENNRKVDCGITKNIAKSARNLGESLMGFTGVLDTSLKDCKKVTLDVVNSCTLDGQHPRAQQGYLESSKVKNINACAFVPTDGSRRKVNPVSGMVCETFQTGRDSKPLAIRKKPCCSDMPDDPFIKIYYTSLGLLMLYIIIKMTMRR